jgi:hypothetical protein
MKISASPTNLSISHVNVATGLPYDRLIPAFEASLGKWDPVAGAPLWEKKANWPEVETAIAKMAEPFGLMVMVKIDQGPHHLPFGKSKKVHALCRRQSRDREPDHRDRSARQFLRSVPDCRS